MTTRAFHLKKIQLGSQVDDLLHRERRMEGATDHFLHYHCTTDDAGITVKVIPDLKRVFPKTELTIRIDRKNDVLVAPKPLDIMLENLIFNKGKLAYPEGERPASVL